MADKTFSHAVPFQETLDNAKYTNNEPVSTTPNFSQVVVHDWDNVKTLDKTAIIAEAAAYGYTAIN